MRARFAARCRMLSREQAQAITRSVHLLRPAWNEEGIYAALAKCKDRDPYDVALAAIRAARDTNTKTPGVIPTPGPHWNEEAPKAPTKPRLSREERRARTCATCGALDGCGLPAHEFIPLDHASRNRGGEAGQARAELEQIRTTACRHGVVRSRVKCGDCEVAEKSAEKEPA